MQQTASSYGGVNAFSGNFAATFGKANTAGDAIWVVVSAPSKDSPGNVAWTFAVSDSQGNTYQQVGSNENDYGAGSQSVAQFVAFNIKGGGNQVTFTMSYNGAPGGDNYLGIYIVEVAGASGTYEHGGNVQDNATAGANEVTSGPISAPNGSIFVLAFSMNTNGGASDTGGSGLTGPTVGTGLTQYESMVWPMDGSTPLGTFATGALTPSGGTVQALFNASPATSTGQNDYATVAIGFY